MASGLSGCSSCEGDVATVCAAGSFDDPGEPGLECVPFTVCDPGEFVASPGSGTSDRVCAACSSGTFATSSNADSCLPHTLCAAGTERTTTGTASTDAVCSPCATGTYSTMAGAASGLACEQHTACQPGQYVSTEGSPTANRVCTACAVGSFSVNANATACVLWTDCSAGEFVAAVGRADADRTCAACVVGTFTSGANQSLCVPIGSCAPGTEEVTPGTPTMPTQCRACSPGTYCAGGATTATPCATGSWDHDADPSTACVAHTDCAPGESVATPGDATTNRVCTTCASGSFSTAPNAAACTGYTVCAPGQFVSVAGSTTSDQACSSCAAGTFAAATNEVACLPHTTCVAGEFVSEPGSSTTDRTCAACPSGTSTSGPNQSICLPPDACLAGTVETTPAMGSQPAVCTACTAGTYCAGGTNPVVPCASGSWDHDGDPATTCAAKTTCVPGESVASEGSTTGDRVCARCGDGFSTVDDAPTCTPYTTCVAGEYVSVAGTASADQQCAACASGTYSTEEDSLVCTAQPMCRPGEYVAGGGSATSPQTCADCSPGTFSLTDDASACVAWTSCPAGEYVATAGSSTNDAVCMTCPVGTYTNGPDQSQCVPVGSCAPGTEQTAPASGTNPPTCRTCTPGEYCAGDTTPATACGASGADTFDHDLDPSTVCTQRAVCGAGTYVAADGGATSDRVCVACSGSTFSAIDNAPSCTAHRDCAEGNFVLAEGTTTTDRQCAPCAPGEYSNSQNASACTTWTHCVPGTYVSSAGTVTSDRTCQACGSGTFSGAIDAGTCAVWSTCMAGSYVVQAGTSSADRTCAPCASGTYTSGSNEATCLPVGACAAGTVLTAPPTSTSPAVCDPCSIGSYCAGGTEPVVDCGALDGQWDDDHDPATACVARTTCSPGSFVLSEGNAVDDRRCSPCAADTFSTDSNVVSCSPTTHCAAGTRVVAAPTPTSDRTCAPCASGTFTDGEDEAACAAHRDCLPGQYVAAEGTAAADRTCDGCASASFSTTTNAVSCTPWSTCAAGTRVRNTPSFTEDRVCEACPYATYTAGPNESTCLANDACPAGTYASSVTAPDCTPCVAGEHCEGGTQPPVPCAVDTWDHDLNPATACVDQRVCFPGRFVATPGTSTSDRVCGDCAVDLGQCDGGDGDPVPCEAGYTDAANLPACLPLSTCVPGEYDANWVTGRPESDRDCQPCDPESYSEEENAVECYSWDYCYAGQYVEVDGTPTSNRVCADCVDSYSTVDNAPACVPYTTCPPGQIEGVPSSYDHDRTCVRTFDAQFGSTQQDEVLAVQFSQNFGTFSRPYWIAGSTTGSLIRTNAGLKDAFVYKVPDRAGVGLVSEMFGTPGDDYVTAMDVDGSGTMWMVGRAGGQLPDSPQSFGGGDIFLRKYTPSGSLEWCVQFGTAGDDIPHDVLVHWISTRVIMIVGSTTGAFPGETDGPGADAFVLWVDGANGALLDVDQFSGTLTNGNDVATGITLFRGIPYVSGTVDGEFAGHTGAGLTDGFIRRYSGDATHPLYIHRILDWTRQFGTSTYESEIRVTEWKNGYDVPYGLAVAGHTWGQFPGQPGPAAPSAFVQLYDVDGVEQWTAQFGNGFVFGVGGLSSDRYGVVSVVGTTPDRVAGSTPVGGLDAFVTALDPTGAIVRSRNFGTALDDRGLAIDVAFENGNVLLGGSTTGTFPTYTNIGGRDAFMTIAGP